jgi:hypothetical protein
MSLAVMLIFLAKQRQAKLIQLAAQTTKKLYEPQ